MCQCGVSYGNDSHCANCRGIIVSLWCNLREMAKVWQGGSNSLCVSVVLFEIVAEIGPLVVVPFVLVWF